MKGDSNYDYNFMDNYRLSCHHFPVIIFLWLIGVYNGLIRLKNRTNEAWSDIDVQLKRRYNLIPNLVESVKGYAKHERELFEKVTKARRNTARQKIRWLAL